MTKRGLLAGALFVIWHLSFGILTAHAHTEFFIEAPTNVRPGTVFPATLMARVDQSINALRVVLRFDPTRLTIVSADDRDSVVRYWLERPAPSASGSMAMEGIIPGGVGPGFTDTVIIARLSVRAQRIGNTTVRIDDAQVYLNQPNPTPDTVSTRPFTVRVRENSPVFLVQPLADAAVDAEVRLVKEPTIHDGAWSLVFDVRTEQGTAVVRVRERRFGFGGQRHDVISPQRLSDQWLTSMIEVAVSDGSSERVVRTIVPFRLKAIFALAALLAAGTVLLLIRRRYG